MGKFAVIDIGSNSVRLVVYESLKRAPYVAFNEKILCGLGTAVSQTGKMSDEAMDMALHTLKRFSILLKKMDVTNYRAVATAAVRDASNGKSFIKKIQDYCDINVKIIDGREEGRLSGMGVICAMPSAKGIVGDLGGGSLELIEIGEGHVRHANSLPIGPLRLRKNDIVDDAQEKKMIDKSLQSLKWLPEHKGGRFFAVGGAWRALAKLHMTMTDYPLINLHHYAISYDEAIKLCEYASRLTPEQLQTEHNLSSRRLKILPLAALILQKTLETIQPSEIIISGHGLREGLVFENMTPKVRAQDPLLQGCFEMAEITGRFPEHGRHLKKWIDPLFADETAEDAHLRLAICMLSDVGWRGHPEYRAERVYSDILYSRFLGLDHRGCALTGLALYICYGGTTGKAVTKIAEAILSEKDIQYALQIGTAIRLAQRLSAGTARGLKAITLGYDQETITLHVKPGKGDLINEVVEKRLSSLARVFNAQVQILNVDPVSP